MLRRDGRTDGRTEGMEGIAFPFLPEKKEETKEANEKITMTYL